jgi:hypothetical protein
MMVGRDRIENHGGGYQKVSVRPRSKLNLDQPSELRPELENHTALT